MQQNSENHNQHRQDKQIWQFSMTIQQPAKITNSLKLKIFDDKITLQNSNKIFQQILIHDIIGVKLQKYSQKNPQYCNFIINNFPKKQTGFFKKKLSRKIQKFSIWIKIKQKQIERIKLFLIQKISNRKISNTSDPLVFLIYLNPNAGANSRKHFVAVQHFLQHTNFTYQLIQTTHRGHCQQHLSELNYKKYQGIVIISGDGLMHQFVNSKVCGKIPVTHVPGGSGNAFSKAQTKQAGQQCKDEQAMFLAIKGRTKNMNLVEMQLENQLTPIYSFLSLQWAFLADIDMNSEFLRFLGGLRFEIYAAYRCMSLHRYPGKITFSTTSTDLPPLNEPINNQQFTSIQTNFLNAIFLSIPFISDQYQWGPLLKVQQQAIDMQFITSDNGRYQLIKYLLNSDHGDHFDKQKGTIKQGFQFTHKKIKSYRLQPTGQGVVKGIFGIDGQRYEAQRMQARISEKKLLTFI